MNVLGKLHDRSQYVGKLGDRLSPDASVTVHSGGPKVETPAFGSRRKLKGR
ncbi:MULTISPECIES: hypothetical protein [Sinorhizobium]|uniref:hypothetical protein n=1 Tax=Sinorhizobium TaxID=28105 RepID=UPI0024B17677|nr:hypothetical protein [Sinorhizobium terangae]WFU51979.1 hypothetical protein QA637_29195 [Sinorhizobium terangae]